MGADYQKIVSFFVFYRTRYFFLYTRTR